MGRCDTPDTLDTLRLAALIRCRRGATRISRDFVKIPLDGLRHRPQRAELALDLSIQSFLDTTRRHSLFPGKDLDRLYARLSPVLKLEADSVSVRERCDDLVLSVTGE